MSDDLVIELNGPPIVTITQNCSFEDFIAQFQTSCSKLLCIVNGKQLHYYDRKAELPIGLKFEYKRKFSERTAYYFRDVVSNTYCLFGRETAQQFYPRLEEVDPVTTVTTVTESTLASIPSTHNKRDYKVSKLDKPDRTDKPDKPDKPKAIVTKSKVSVVNTRIVRAKCPSEVVIVDCGQCYTFPHANYNIEVYNHQIY